MKTSEAPDRIYVHWSKHAKRLCASAAQGKGDIEYVRTDAFIDKAKKWFGEQNEWFDSNGVRHCGLEDFEDFVNYVEEE